MNDELNRFFNSIGFISESFTNSQIEKVVLKKKEELFEVFIKNDSVIDVLEVVKLFSCAKKGINGSSLCKVNMIYETITKSDIEKYLNYLIDELIIKRPSLIGLKNSVKEIKNNEINILVTSDAEQEDLLNETKKIIKNFSLFGFKNIVINVLIDSNKRDLIKEEIETIKKTVEAPAPSNMVMGMHKDGSVTKLNNILGETRNIIVEVYIFAKEFVERSGKKGPIYILNLKVSDNTDSYLMKIVKFNEEEFIPISKELKEDNWYRIHGSAVFDEYLKSMIINPRDIEKIPSKESEHKDTSLTKRVELHAHTMMSMMDSVVNTNKLIKHAIGMGHKAIAITDHNVLQAYPDVFNAVEKANKGKSDENKFKALYGAELNVVDLDTFIVFNNKEYSLFDQEYIVYDTETTGLNYGVDQMIEIGAVKVKNNEVIETFDELIACPNPLPKIITELTSITDEDLVGKDTEENVTKRFLKFCGSLPLVAHNAAFDIAFVTNAMKKYNLGDFKSTVIDTMGLARNMYPNWRNHKLSTLVKNLDVEWDEEKHHRADYDCEGTAKCLYKMFNELKNDNYKTTIDLEKLADQEQAIKFARPFHLDVIAKNATGLKNLFKIISLANTKYLYKGKEPKIPRNDLINLQEGLLVGSGCVNGEVFEKGFNLTDDELSEMMKFYDYIEVCPASACTHLIGPEKKFHSEIEYNNYIKRLVRVGESSGKLVCAVGDVHNLYKEDLIYRKVIVHQKANGKIHPLNRKDTEVPNMYFLSTDEMLEAFSFLDEETRNRIVITNTNKIADEVVELQIIRDKLYTPLLENSAEITKEMVYKRAHELYGDPLPKIVDERLIAELDGIIGGGYDVIYLIAEKLVKKSNEDGYFVGSRGSVGSSLVATMMGITEVNGLAPHYLCPKCKKSIFEIDGVTLQSLYVSGYDMPDKTCECGTKMNKEGQDMPFATFLGFKAEKVPDIDLNFSSENQGAAHNHVKELFGEDHAYRAGTISTVAEKTAFGYVKGYFEANNIIANNAEIERIAKGCTGVKRTTGQHPGGIIVIPQYMDIFDFSPYQFPADEPDSTWYTTHFDFHAIHDNVLKLDILGHDDPTMLKYLGDTTKVNILDIPFDDKNVLSLFNSPKILNVTEEDILCKTGTLGIPEFGTGFVINMLMEIKPTHFSDLVKMAGLSHGTNVWAGNVRDIIVDKVATFAEVVGCRDDIMVSLINYGLEPSKAFKISEFVRKGKAKKEPETWLGHASLMREHSVPEWFIECCRKIEYMFPKAHACAYVMMAYRVAWFKLYYPLYYYSAYFSIRRSDFDVSAMLNGYDGIKRKLIEIKEKGYGASPKETAVADTLAVALEMLARGFKFKNIDIEKSLAKTFFIDALDKSLYLPFMALDGLGESVANKIIEEREKKPFYCIEDFQTRGKVNQTAINALKELDVFGSLPESAQLSFF
ncbi:MAG: PolC-type DNA polymerase III [Bacilli bacterium]